jgi:tight adherence protein B
MNWLDSILKPGSNLQLIFMALVAASLGGVMLSLIALQESERKRKRDLRINRSTRQAAVATAKNLPKDVPNVRLQLGTSKYGAVDAIIRRVVPNLATFRTRLRRTGYNIPIDYYFLSCLLLGVLAGEGVKVFFGLSLTVAILIGLPVGLIVPHLVVGIIGRRRLKRMLEQFPDAIDMIVRAVRSGLPVSEAIKVIADQVRPPLGYEFQQVVDAMKLGSTLNEALDAASERIEFPEFRFFIIALSIQQDTGGNLGETLENLSKMLRRRRQMKMKVKAVTAEARASAWILGCMPFVMFVIIFMINRDYAMVLVTDPRGITMILVGLTMTCTGIAIMVKLAKFQI